MIDWETLLLEAAKIPMSDGEKAEQRLSFAFGNTHIENEKITREMIAEEAERIDDADKSARSGK